MSASIEFAPWPKVPRLRQRVVITEKIDGTNAAVGIRRLADDEPVAARCERIHLVHGKVFALRCQSRKRFVTVDDDNYGFARWANEHAEVLIEGLGEGLHYGEWWGRGIQRGYGVEGKRFSLFNTGRWAGVLAQHDADACEADVFPLTLAGVRVVPVLKENGEFDTEAVGHVLHMLETLGSAAAPGFMRPEGVIVFHPQSQAMFKKLIGAADLVPKGMAS